MRRHTLRWSLLFAVVFGFVFCTFWWPARRFTRRLARGNVHRCHLARFGNAARRPHGAARAVISFLTMALRILWLLLLLATALPAELFVPIRGGAMPGRPAVRVDDLRSPMRP